MSAHTHSICSMPDHGNEAAAAACCRPSSPSFMGPTVADPHGLLDAGSHGGHGHAAESSFWMDGPTWVRAAKNTLNCLIGCSIGDFGAIIIIQTFYPETPVMLMMAIAMSAGLITSIMFESVLLRFKEGFDWRQAVKVAFSMSVISMLGMEAAANATDYLLTGGTVAPSEPWFWGALAISMVVGFLAPLPYNYRQLRKFGKACH